MNINREEIIKKLDEIGRPDLIESSAIHGNSFIEEFMKELNPRPEGIIEIGTFNGVSSVVFASMGKIVYTYDIAYRGAEHIWNLFGVRDKIRCCVGPQWLIDEEIKIVIQRWQNKLNFNFAFIDGKHDEESVRHDFELVKFCKRVLFHDYFKRQIRKFMDEIGAKSMGPKHPNGRCVYAYWEAEGE